MTLKARRPVFSILLSTIFWAGCFTAAELPAQSPVTAAQALDFSLAASPAAVAVTQDSTGTSVITVTPVGGFAGSVALSASGLPAGVTASFNPVSTTGTSTLTFTASAAATTGTANLTVTRTSGSLSHTSAIASDRKSCNRRQRRGNTIDCYQLNSAFFDDEGLKLSNTAPITALAITIIVQNTGRLSFNGQYSTVGGQIMQSHSSRSAVITYQFNLQAGQTLSPGTNYLFDAQMAANGTAHPTGGDTFTVTYTTGGQTFTQSGHF